MCRLRHRSKSGNAVLTGLLDISTWGIVAYTLVVTHLTIICVTVYLHRHQAHRALDLHPVVSHPMRFWLWLTTGMVTRQWVAVHRKHHACVESERDPHSPRQEGILKVLLEGTELYRKEAAQEDTLERYGHGAPEDWIERKLYTSWSSKGYCLMLAINLMLFGPIGLTVWAVQMLWIPFLAAGVINGVGHWWGYRNFETADMSTNVHPLRIDHRWRGTAQQPSCVRELGEALGEVVGVRCRVALHPGAAGVRPRPRQEASSQDGAGTQEAAGPGCGRRDHRGPLFRHVALREDGALAGMGGRSFGGWTPPSARCCFPPRRSWCGRSR